MKRLLVLAFVVTCASPAFAQLGGLGKVLDKAKKAEDEKKQLDELTVSDDEEQKIGAEVSGKIRERFGVVQDGAVTKYVTLVGTLLAQETDRPKLPWTFIVLDTDGVNAFAAPGGYVHITRGALGLIENEAQLAGVLGHEIGHVAHKHAINAIRKNKAVELGTNTALKDRSALLDRVAQATYGSVIENAYDRGDELDADAMGVKLSGKLGYAPAALGDFLTRLDDRNKDQPAKNGLFASHPQTRERIDKIHQLAGSSHGALAEARYKSNVAYQATDVARIAVVTEGSSGLAGSSGSDDSNSQDKEKDKDKNAKDDQPKKKGFGLSSLTKSSSTERQSAQVSASGGARGVGPDRAARGGSNPHVVVVNVSPAELATFKKGIAG